MVLWWVKTLQYDEGSPVLLMNHFQEKHKHLEILKLSQGDTALKPAALWWFLLFTYNYQCNKHKTLGHLQNILTDQYGPRVRQCEPKVCRTTLPNFLWSRKLSPTLTINALLISYSTTINFFFTRKLVLHNSSPFFHLAKLSWNQRGSEKTAHFLHLLVQSRNFSVLSSQTFFSLACRC